ncbi:MAG: chaperonin GroEL, partial [Verrucomicrobiota bacterium]|nr:chaperonin GroEL [Verrucomicrobiota bacterium]
SAEIAGDGTTTSTVLAHEMYARGRQMVAAGFDPMRICKGIQEGTAAVSDAILKMSEEVKSREDIVNVATISANGDREIGDIIASALDAVGKNGVVTVEPAKGFDTTLDVVEGVKFERGYVSPYFVTDQDRLHTDFNKCEIFVTSQKIDNIKKILPVLEKSHETNKPLLIVCADIDPEVIQALVVNKLKGTLSVCVVKAPLYGDVQVEVLKDIASVTGTRAVNAGDYDESTGSLKEGWVLGKCRKAIITKGSTLLVGCSPDEETVESRLEVVRENLTRPNMEEQERDYYAMRSSMLSGAVAVIKVGGATEVEMRERKDRVDDAVSATVAANLECILPGGGTALVTSISRIKK